MSVKWITVRPRITRIERVPARYTFPSGAAPDVAVRRSNGAERIVISHERYPGYLPNQWHCCSVGRTQPRLTLGIRKCPWSTIAVLRIESFPIPPGAALRSGLWHGGTRATDGAERSHAGCGRRDCRCGTDPALNVRVVLPRKARYTVPISIDGDPAVTLTILTIADEVCASLYDRFQPERWRSVDLVLSSGDLPPEYLDYLCTRLNVPILYVRGNHDGSYRQSQFDGCTNVHGRIVECRGLRIAGFEGCRRYNGGPVQYSESEMRHRVGRLRLQSYRHGPPHIVLSHAPPAGCHDGSDTAHRGFECFNRLIEAWKPAYFVHGHTHAYYGCPPVTRVGATTVVNAYPFRLIQVPVSDKVAKKSVPDQLPDRGHGWRSRVRA